MYKILIVEDDVIPAAYLRDILEDRGWRVVDVVDNAIDAMRSLKKYSPDLVLMDIIINDTKSGCEVALDIRRISDCSIVFTTAHANDEMISYAVEAKADAYIVKPYNEKEIIATISLLSIKNNNIHNGFNTVKIDGNFTYENDTGLLYKNGKVVKLGPKALKFIQLLCANKDNYVNYHNIYKHIWKGEVNLKKLQMVAYRVREVCEADFLDNIHSLGYKIKLDRSIDIS